MPIEIKGVQYYTAPEVIEDIDISRQTLWRWRRQGLIPAGHKHRRTKVVFTAEDMAKIRDYADCVEPVNGDTDKHQLRLFDSVT